MSDPAVEAVARLVEAADSPEFQARMRGFGVNVLTVFGSAAPRFEGRVKNALPANDLDIGVMFADPTRLLELIDVLVSIAQYDRIDVAIIDRQHPVLDSEALCGIPLYEDVPGRYANEQMAALAHRRDTAFLRELDLALMAK